MTLPFIFATLPGGNTPASDLDANFSILEGGLLQPVTATGSVNAYVLTPLDAWVTGYAGYKANGLSVIFPITNTGAVSVNVSGLGAVTLQKNSGGVATALAAGDIVANVPYVIVCDGSVFWLTNPTQATSTPILNQQVFTTGSGNWTTPTNISASTVFKLTITGGGAGGGTGGTLNGGGGAGATCVKWVTGLSASTAYAYAVGASGAGGATPANGGDSTLIINATTYTGGGGVHGVVTNGAGGAGGVATNGTLNVNGGDGASVLNSSNPGGSGGASFWGGGGRGAITAGSGVVGSAYGSGGGGGASNASGAGATGVIQIEWVA